MAEFYILKGKITKSGVGQIKPKAKKFRVNQCLRARSICDYNCVFYGYVIDRTENTLTLNLESESYGIKKRKIYKDEEGNEYCFPFGKYSMAPIFRAEEKFIWKI